MGRTILFAVVGAILMMVVGLMIGLFTGMNIGGNYFSDFEFEGMRGYVATGTIGLRVGAVAGALIGAVLGIALARKGKTRKGSSASK